MNKFSVPKPVDGYRIEEIDGEYILYHPDESQTVYLNDSAAVVWQLCDGNRSIDVIVSLLRDCYPDVGDEMSNDVGEAIRLLVDSKGLILEEPAPTDD